MRCCALGGPSGHHSLPPWSWDKGGGGPGSLTWVPHEACTGSNGRGRAALPSPRWSRGPGIWVSEGRGSAGARAGLGPDPSGNTQPTDMSPLLLVSSSPSSWQRRAPLCQPCPRGRHLSLAVKLSLSMNGGSVTPHCQGDQQAIEGEGSQRFLPFPRGNPPLLTDGGAGVGIRRSFSQIGKHSRPFSE